MRMCIRGICPPAYIKECCEGSLKRLGMEYIDLYQPHRIDYLAHPEETARALEDLKAEGKDSACRCEQLFAR